MDDLLREYQMEHPEECAQLNRILANSRRVESERRSRAKKRLEKVRKWEEILNGK